MSHDGTIPKTLVVGAHGFLGRHFLEAYRTGDPHAIGTRRHELDLMQPDISALPLEGVRFAVIAAAVTKIAQCERAPQSSYLCNVAGTLSLVEQLRRKQITPVLFSTDYVFDGILGDYDENSPMSPLNEYGRQKAALQHGVIERSGDDFLLIRPSKVFGMTRGDRTLLDEIAETLRRHESVRAAVDAIFNPILVTDLVQGVILLQRRGCRGIYHMGGEIATRLAIAERIAKRLGASASLVQSISVDDLGEPFQRPKNTSLRSGKFFQETGYAFTSWKTCVDTLSWGVTNSRNGSLS